MLDPVVLVEPFELLEPVEPVESVALVTVCARLLYALTDPGTRPAREVRP
ncbi:hypothetical protein [Streptomyces yaizuensis]|uniref:Uncharacterized protein n=1 Tax=Streptomyces yaizuensis TaxID=2989713 RepID=A0ABQ5PAH5_9ACTN|nr:hypothetical protein [Streptomyces sp. YSPA8]GLF99581.1 hypothetical protein SYYSPA8_34810 [Streptomyces sp. YSPA8]